MKPVPPVTRMVFFIFRLWNRGGKHARRSFNLFYDVSSDHMPSASWGWLWCGEVTNYFVISILQKTTFFCALRSKTFPFRRNPPQKFFVRSSKRIKSPKCRGDASPTLHNYIAPFGSWSSTFILSPCTQVFKVHPTRKSPYYKHRQKSTTFAENSTTIRQNIPTIDRKLCTFWSHTAQPEYSQLNFPLFFSFPFSNSHDITEIGRESRVDCLAVRHRIRKFAPN